MFIFKDFAWCHDLHWIYSWNCGIRLLVCLLLLFLFPPIHSFSLSHHVTKGMEISLSMGFPITSFNFVCFASIRLFVNYPASSASCNSMKKNSEGWWWWWLRMMASRVLLAFENLSLIFGSKTKPRYETLWTIYLAHKPQNVKEKWNLVQIKLSFNNK
jgi:hypothetical protein